MEEDWYTVEQQIRDRLTEARTAARIRSLSQGLAPAARRPHSVGTAFIRFASWVWARARELPPEGSGGVANVRTAREDTNHG